MIIYFAAGKDGDPRCRAAGIEDTAQRRVSIGEKEQKKQHRITGKRRQSIIGANVILFHVKKEVKMKSIFFFIFHNVLKEE